MKPFSLSYPRKPITEETCPTVTRFAEKIILVLSCITLISACTRAGFSVSGIHITITDFLIGISTGVLFLSMLKTEYREQLRLPSLSIFIFITLALISAFFSGERKRALLEVIQFSELLIFGWLILGFVLQKKFSWIISSALVLLGITVFSCNVDYFFRPGPAEQIGGLLDNRMIYGAYTVLLAPLAMGCISAQSSPTGKAAAAAGFVLLLIPVTSGWILLCLVLGCLFTLLLTRDRLSAGLMAGAAVVFFLCMGFLPRDNPELLRESVYPVNENRIKQQYLEWIAASTGTAKNALTGTGPGTYQEHIGQYFGSLDKPNVNALEPDTNNTYAVIGLTMGVPGLLCFLFLLLESLTLSLCTAFSLTVPKQIRGAAAGCAGSLFACIFLCLFTVPLVRGTGIIMALLLSMAAYGHHLTVKKALNED